MRQGGREKGSGRGQKRVRKMKIRQRRTGCGRMKEKGGGGVK